MTVTRRDCVTWDSAPDILTTAQIYVKSRITEMDDRSHKSDEEELCNHELNSKYEIAKKNNTPNPFKTPKNPLYCTKSTKSLKRDKKYQNLISPIASYIHDSPCIPLIRNVRPALAGISKHNLDLEEKVKKVTNENDNIKKKYASLPLVAYRTAKETRVINLPSKLKLPKSRWAQKVVSANPKPVVVQHCYRLKDTKLTPHIRPLDDSTNELFWNQADLSICTQRPAIKKS